MKTLLKVGALTAITHILVHLFGVWSKKSINFKIIFPSHYLNWKYHNTFLKKEITLASNLRKHNFFSDL
jgi:hypothetical protein